MPQVRLNRAVARATGESHTTIARMGFVPLTRGPVERERLVVDAEEQLDPVTTGLRPPFSPPRAVVG
jgi:hypothetical protein